MKNIIKNFEAKAVKHQGNAKEGYSVLVEDINSNFKAWVDVWVDSDYQDVRTEWNKYIFRTDDDNDVKEKLIMDNDDVFEDATSEAVYYLEDKKLIHQDDQAKWYY